MATKNYMINDKWLDLDKQNIVELQSVDGVLDSLKVNGSEIETPSGKITITENGTDIDIAQYALADVNVEGGGGSSDFSTAEVTIANNIDNNVSLYMPLIYDTTPIPSIDKAIYCAYSLAEGAPSETVRVALYGGTCLAQPAPDIMGKTFTVTGNAEYSNGMIIITGDCTITIS